MTATIDPASVREALAPYDDVLASPALMWAVHCAGEGLLTGDEALAEYNLGRQARDWPQNDTLKTECLLLGDLEESLATLEARGLAERDGQGWRVTETGGLLYDRLDGKV
jgi:hypothetical protein